MRRLLLLASLLLGVFIWSCNSKAGSKGQQENIDKEISHSGPNQAKLDSIKAAKTKGKQ